MYFAVHKKKQEVKMRSMEKPTVDKKIFDVHEYNPTPAEMEKIDENYSLYWRSGTLVLEKSPAQASKEEEEFKKEKLAEVKVLTDKPVMTPKDTKEALIAIREILEQ